MPRSLAPMLATALCLLPFGVVGCGGNPDKSGRAPDTVRDVGLRDRIAKRPPRDEASIRRMLEAKGATAEHAQELVAILSRRLPPEEMHVWLAHPFKSHPVPDPEAAKELAGDDLIATPMNWTPINAVAAGKIDLVMAEAKRYVAR